MKELIDIITQSIQQNKFVKITLGNYKGYDEALKNIYIKRILIKREEKLNVVFRYKTKDITKNYSLQETLDLISNQLTEHGFRILVLFTLDFDLQYEFQPTGWRMHQMKPTMNIPISLEHNKQKERKLASEGKKYLYELKITDREGSVYKNAQDKFKQINHFIEILSSLLEKLPKREWTKVVDMGSGKGYLTFALYDYLNHTLGLPSEIIGVEYRKDLVDLCHLVAIASEFKRLNFRQGTIQDFESKDFNVLIALHACDTATDDAIMKGIEAQSDLIVVAPCCHKQIRRDIEASKPNPILKDVLKQGIFLERQSEMITDTIRVLILEYFGYKTKVVEFISDVHTPKNVMIIAQKSEHKKQSIEKLNDIKTLKEFYGIQKHYLEKILENN